VNSIQNKARFAGLLYLLTAIPNVSYLIYVPSVLIVPGDATATAGRIMASESLFRMGIVSELAGATIFIFVVLALQDLLKSVNKKYASLMVTFFVISVPISCVNVLNQIAVLRLLRGDSFLSVFDQHQLDALVMVFLNLHGYGTVVAQIFWGLWLFPFGVLVFKSGVLPRILGVLLIIGCFGYIAASVTVLLFPTSGHMVHELLLAPGGVAELSILLWLLIKGVQARPLQAAA
jgi:hypothetical protein